MQKQFYAAMKSHGLFSAVSILMVGLVTASGQTPAVHRLDGITVLPDRAVSLFLSGSAPTNSLPYFDLYVLERSTDLRDWTPLATLVRTNASTNALRYLDSAAAGVGHQFYRTISNHVITPLSKPTGPYPVGTVSRLVTDPSRTNRYNIATNSSFMITLWYPATARTGILPEHYLDPNLARENRYGVWPDGTLVAQFRSHGWPAALVASNASPLPVLFYAYGSSTHRQSNTEQCEELASHGLLVVGVEFAEGLGSAFPDGRLVYGPARVPDDLAGEIAALPGRIGDVLFVLKELDGLNKSDSDWAGRMDLDKVGIFGTSFGAAVASELCRTNTQFKAAAFLDGYFAPAPLVLSNGLSQPTLSVNSESDPGQPGWLTDATTIFTKSATDAYVGQVKGAVHSTFADYGRIVNTSGLARERTAAAAIHACVLSFFKKYLLNQDNHLLDDPVATFPTVFNFRTKALRIVTQPPHQNIVRGLNGTLNVTATSGLPIRYQWNLNGTQIASATNASLTITNAQDDDAGSYRVVLTDGLTALTSQAAVVQVGSPPVITQQPVAQTVPLGGNATFSLTVIGTPPFGFSWRKVSAVLTNIVQNETTSTFTLFNVRTNDAVNYRVVVTNAFNMSPGVASPLVPITVTAP